MPDQQARESISIRNKHTLLSKESIAKFKKTLSSWPADKSDGIGTTSRITQVKACDVLNGALTTINVTVNNSVKDYFDAAMTNCTSEIPAARKSRALIFLGKIFAICIDEIFFDKDHGQVPLLDFVLPI